MLDLFEQIPTHFNNEPNFSFLVRTVRDNVVSSGRLQRIANAKDEREMFAALDMLEKNKVSIFKKGLKEYQDATDASVDQALMALRRIAATKLMWEKLQELSVDVDPKKRQDALQKMEALLKVDTDPDEAATVLSNLKDFLIPYGVDELEILFPATTTIQVDSDQLVACAQGLAKAAQKTYVQAYFNQYISGEGLEIADPQAAVIAAFVATEGSANDRREALVTVLNSTSQSAPTPPFTVAMLDQLGYETRTWKEEARKALPKKRELGELRQQAAYALMTSKIKEITTWLWKQPAPTTLKDQTQKANHEKVLIDIAQAGQDQKAIVRALHLHRSDLGLISFTGHVKDEVLLNKEQKLALGTLATQKLSALGIPLDIVTQHKKLLDVMREFRSLSMLDAMDYKAASALKSWHDKKQPAVPVQEATLGKVLRKEQDLLDSDLNAACKYVNEVSKGLETLSQAAKQKASKAAQAGLMNDETLKDFLSKKLDKCKQAFTETITKLSSIKNANGTRQEITDQLDRCHEAYQAFSKEIQWANKVADHFNEMKLKFKVRYPNQHAGLFDHIEEGLKKLYEKPQVTALNPQIVFDRLCTGLMEDKVDTVTLTQRLSSLQKESDDYDTILKQVKIVFEHHPEQRAPVLKKLEAHWEDMVRHGDKGRQALKDIVSKLNGSAIIAVGEKEKAKTLSTELRKPITQFVSEVQEEVRKNQRIGVRDLNAAQKGPFISTAQFHGYKRKEFDDALKKELHGETMQSALRLNEEIEYVRYKRPDAAGGALVPLLSGDEARADRD